MREAAREARRKAAMVDSSNDRRCDRERLKQRRISRGFVLPCAFVSAIVGIVEGSVREQVLAHARQFPCRLQRGGLHKNC